MFTERIVLVVIESEVVNHHIFLANTFFLSTNFFYKFPSDWAYLSLKCQNVSNLIKNCILFQNSDQNGHICGP